MLFLGIDAGTTSLKAGLFDEHGTARAMALQEYDLLTPSPDEVEFDPEEYWSACIRAVRAVIERANAEPREVTALAVSSQGETTIAVDERGRALRPALVWLDNRASSQAEKIGKLFDAREVYAATGNPQVVATWTACKILWLKETEPDVFRRARKFVLVEDFLLNHLTGRFVTDGAVACSSLLWDARRDAWWDEMLAFLGITRERLAEPIAPGAIAGTLTREAANTLGLSPGTAVIAGGMDQAASALGAGNIHSGIISESTGSALTIQATIPRRDLDPTRRLPVNVHVVPGAFLFLAVCPTGGMALRWFRDQFAQGERRAAREQNRDAYELLDELAAHVEPGCEGLTMLPHLMGAFSPEYNSHARGVFYGFSPRHTKAHFVRAILEAIAFVIKRNLDLMQSLGVSAREIIATGGGASSALWCRIKSDVTGLAVLVLEQPETTILGDAILAAVALDRFRDLEEACAQMVRVRTRIEPNLATQGAYARAYARYCSLYDHVASLFDEVN